MYKLKMLAVSAYCRMVFVTLFCAIVFCGCSGDSTIKGPDLKTGNTQDYNLPKNPGNEIHWNENLYGSETQYWEEKVYWDTLTPDSVIAENAVTVVLSKFASSNYEKTYTTEDFSEIDCSEVFELTALTLELVKKQIIAERTGDWSELQEHVRNGMLMDLNTFRRILYVRLTNPSVENVRNAINLLEERRDFIYVGPDYYFSMPSFDPEVAF